MKNTDHFCYREAKNEQELETLLRLRYETYRNSKLAGFCPENSYGMDLDAWDVYATHFGLFRIENGQEEPVGYMRVIQQEETQHSTWIKQIAWRCSLEVFEKVSVGPKVPFPVMEYFPGAKKGLKDIVENERSGGQKAGEASRFLFRHDFQSFRLAINMIESAMASNFFSKGFSRSIISCTTTHAKIYNLFGWNQVEETGVYEVQSGNGRRSLLLMLWSFSNFNQTAKQKTKEKIAKMAQAFRQTGCIYFHPNRPNNFYPPAYFKLPKPTSQQFMAAVHKALDHNKPVAKAS